MKKFLLFIYILINFPLSVTATRNFSFGVELTTGECDELNIVPSIGIDINRRVTLSLQPSVTYTPQGSILFNGIKINCHANSSASKIAYLSNVLIAHHAQKFIDCAHNKLDTSDIMLLNKQLLQHESYYNFLLETETNSHRKEKILAVLKKIESIKPLLLENNYDKK